MFNKDKFELIYGRSGELYNIVPLRKSTLSAFQVSKADEEHIKRLCLVYGASRGHTSTKIIEKYINTVKIINLPDYPLTGFVNVEGIPYFNISTIPVSLVSDFTPADVYAGYIYTIALYLFSSKTPFNQNVEEHVSAFYFAVFMKVFGKKSGLLGSYMNLIPKLRFIIAMYVHCGVFGLPDTDDARKKLALSVNLYNIDDIKLDYNFKSSKDFLKCINENRIIPISENVFSSKIINMGGVNSLPMFEDVNRFFSVLLASTISGNIIFSPYWSKVRPDLYKKLVYIATKNLAVIG